MYLSNLSEKFEENVTFAPFANGSEFDEQSFNDTGFDYFAGQIASALNVVYTPILVALGILGNIVSIFVFYSSKLRNQSTSQYLTALAVSDTVFLTQLIPPWLKAVQITGVFHRNIFCQFFIYISYVCCTTSSWLVVAFTIERFVAVIYPLQRNVVCTAARARFVIYTLALFAFMINVPVLRFAKATPNDCNIDEDYMEPAARFNFIDTGISFTVPLAIIVILNSGITFGVYRLEKENNILHREERLRMRQRELIESSPSGRQSQYGQQTQGQHRITRMLVIVSSVFVMLNCPAYTMRMLAYAYDMVS